MLECQELGQSPLALAKHTARSLHQSCLLMCSKVSCSRFRGSGSPELLQQLWPGRRTKRKPMEQLRQIGVCREALPHLTLHVARPRDISDVKHCLAVDVAGLGATLRVLQVSKCAIERGLNPDCNLVQISKNIHKEACKAHNREVLATRFSQEAHLGPQEVLATDCSGEEASEAHQEACPAQKSQEANVAQKRS